MFKNNLLGYDSIFLKLITRKQHFKKVFFLLICHYLGLEYLRFVLPISSSSSRVLDLMYVSFLVSES